MSSVKRDLLLSWLSMMGFELELGDMEFIVLVRHDYTSLVFANNFVNCFDTKVVLQNFDVVGLSFTEFLADNGPDVYCPE